MSVYRIFPLIIIAHTSSIMGCCSNLMQQSSNEHHNITAMRKVSDSIIGIEGSKRLIIDSLRQHSSPVDIIIGDWTLVCTETYNKKTKEGWTLMGNSQPVITFNQDGTGYTSSGTTFFWELQKDKMEIRQENGDLFFGEMKTVTFKYIFRDLGIPADHIGMILKTERDDVERTFQLSRIVNKINE